MIRIKLLRLTNHKIKLLDFLKNYLKQDIMNEKRLDYSRYRNFGNNFSQELQRHKYIYCAQSIMSNINFLKAFEITFLYFMF